MKTGKHGVFDRLDNMEMRWTDPRGVTHAVEGADVHRGVRLLWPKCGIGDVPANAAWKGFDAVTCAACLSTQKGDHPDAPDR